MLDQNNNKVTDGEPLMVNATPGALSEQSDSGGEPKKKLIRQTGWRWLMLTFGCFFLMGSYFCFDNPAPLKNILQKPPYDLSEAQWSGLYSIYSFPNMVLPLFGGIFIDKLGIR